MIYGHFLELGPKEVECARMQARSAYLDCELGICSTERRWISVAQLSKLLQLMPPTELTSMPLLRCANESLLCYDTAQDLSRNHQDLLLRPWSVTLQVHASHASVDLFAKGGDGNVDKCVEFYRQVSNRRKESWSTLSVLLPDRSDRVLSPQWLILPFFLALFLLPAVRFEALRL